MNKTKPKNNCMKQGQFLLINIQQAWQSEANRDAVEGIVRWGGETAMF